MSGTLLDLTLRIATQTAELTQGINEATKKIDGFAGKIQSAGKLIAGAFSVAAIFSAGKAVFDFSQEIGRATANVKSLTGVLDKDLASSTAKLLSISKTFEQDFNNVLLSANAASKQLGITLPDSLDLIEKGLAVSGIRGDEFLDIVKEYPSALNGAGINAEEFFAIASQSVTDGTFSDKGIDSIKEFGLRLREMTPAAQDALTAIGLSGKEIQDQIANGSMTSFQALQMVSARLNAFGDDSKEVGQVLADLFGGAGEDVGINFIKNLATINTDMDTLVNNLDEGSKAQLRLSQATTEWNKVFVNLFGTSSVGFDNLKSSLIEIGTKSLVKIKDSVIDISNYFIKLYNNSILFRGAVQGIVFYFKQLWAGVKLVWKLLVETFSTAGKLIAAVFTGDFESIKEIVSDAFIQIGDSAIEYGKETATNFVDGVNSILENKPIDLISKDTLEKATSDLQSLNVPAIISGKGSASGAGTATGGKEGKKSGAIVNAKDRIEGNATASLTPIIDPSALVVPIQMNTALAELADRMRELQEQTTMWDDVLTNTGEVAKSVFANLANSGIASFQDLAKGIKNGVKSIIKAFLAQAIAGAIKGAFSSGGNPIISAVLAGIGVAAVSVLFNAIPGFAKGTNFAPGGLSLVGELGPELVNLPRGSQVHTNKESMKMLGNYPNDMQLTAVVTGDQLEFVLRENARRK